MVKGSVSPIVLLQILKIINSKGSISRDNVSSIFQTSYMANTQQETHGLPKDKMLSYLDLCLSEVKSIVETAAK